MQKIPACRKPTHSVEHIEILVLVAEEQCNFFVRSLAKQLGRLGPNARVIVKDLQAVIAQFVTAGEIVGKASDQTSIRTPSAGNDFATSQ